MTADTDHVPRAWIEDLMVGGLPTGDVFVRGVAVDVLNGSGLVYREGIPDLQVRVVLDDGSGAITCTFNRGLTEGLLGKTLAQCIERAAEARDPMVIRGDLTDRLIAQPVDVRGPVTKDGREVQMVVREAKTLRVGVPAEGE